jgi:ABC-type glutathione transport system ATPase component
MLQPPVQSTMLSTSRCLSEQYWCLPTSVEKRAGGLRTEDLCRHYEIGGNLVRAVNGVSVEIESGEFAALLGASGSGNLLCQDFWQVRTNPTSGSVTVLTLTDATSNVSGSGIAP